MKDAPKHRINAGILLGGITLATIAGVCSGGTAFLPALGGMLGFVSGMAGNQAQGWLKESADDLPPEHEEVFRNHDIRALLKQAVISVIERVADEHGSSGTIGAAIKKLPDILDTALAAKDGALAGFSEADVPDILTRFAKKKGKTELLTVEAWTAILDKVPAKLWPLEKQSIAEALHRDTGEALWNLVKLDHKKNGQAFAAVELLYLGRILSAVEGKKDAPDPAPMLARIANLVTVMDEKMSGYFQRVFGEMKTFTGKLDGHAKSIVALLEKNTKTAKDTNKRVRGVSKQLNRLDKKLSAADPVRRYLADLSAHYKKHDNVGLPIAAREGDDEKEEAISIRDLFVPPFCSEQRIRPAELDAAILENKTLGKPFLPTLQQPRQRTVLLADPGMGKTTVIQWLIATLTAGKAPESAEELRGAIPFPFILRELAPLMPSNVKKWDWDALLDAFKRWNPRGSSFQPIAAALTADEALWQTLLNDERAFFLIDGLDEIGDPTRRKAIRDAIWEGFERHKDARFLITSRIVGYEVASIHWREPDESKDTSGFIEIWRTTNGKIEPRVFFKNITALFLAPFNNTQQRAFADHWYIPRMGSEAKGTQRAGEFIAAVRQHPHTRVIGRVPNLLYLLALLYRHEANLPNGRALVYAAISKAYLETIPAKRRDPHAGPVPFSPSEKERLLSIVGIEMHRQLAAQDKKGDGDLLVSRAQLGKWLKPRFDDAKSLDEFLSHIAHTSGLLLPRGEDEFGFAHLSFQEFYAACHLQKDFERIADLMMDGAPIPKEDAQLFEKLAALPVWHEPLLFLVERLRDSAPFTKRILKWMFPQLERNDPKKGEKWMPIAAAQLLATLSIDPEVALDKPQRETIWKALWTAHIESWHSRWNVASSLIVAANPFQTAVLDAAAALKPKRFHLAACTAFSDLTPLSGMDTLERLVLIGCTAVHDLTPLIGMGTLQSLILDRCTSLSDLSPLSQVRSLRSLSIDNAISISNLAPLVGPKSRLMILQIKGCTAITDITPLENLHSLMELHLDPYTGIDELKVRALMAKLPNLEIIGPYGGGKSE